MVPLADICHLILLLIVVGVADRIGIVAYVKATCD